MAKPEYCATDEMMKELFGSFSFKDWKGMTDGAKERLANLPDYVKQRIYDAGRVDVNGVVDIINNYADPQRTARLKDFVVPDEEVRQRAAILGDRAAEIMGARQKRQILPPEVAEAANTTLTQKLESIADRGFTFAELIQKGDGNAETLAAQKDMVEALALAHQIAGNSSEAGRLLRWARQMQGERSQSKNLISLFGRMGC